MKIILFPWYKNTFYLTKFLTKSFFNVLGVKHRKVINKLSKSNDPEDALKLKKTTEQTNSLTASKPIENISKPIDSHDDLKSNITINAISSSNTSLGPQTKLEALSDTVKCERNLPPGYVIVPSTNPRETDTFVCKVCHHSSKDVFSVSAVCHLISNLSNLYSNIPIINLPYQNNYSLI